MRQLILVVITLSIVSACKCKGRVAQGNDVVEQQATMRQTTTKDTSFVDFTKTDSVVYDVDEQPEFPGGTEAMNKFLAENLKVVTDDDVVGRVFVQFVVEKDGTITFPKITKSVHPALDREALRIVNGMPKWTPAKKNGHNVRTLYTLPIRFHW